MSWWADNPFTRAARERRRRYQLSMAGALLITVISGTISAVTFWLTDSLYEPIIQMGLPIGIPLLVGPPVFAWFFNVVAELQNHSAWLRREIDQRQRAEAQLERLVSVDDMTGLASRREFFSKAATQAHVPTTVAILDLDHFKRVNDERGHAAGDEVLRIVGGVLLTAGDDVVAGRLGGEEFGMIFPTRSIDDVMSRLDTVRERVTAATGGVTISGGVALRPPGLAIDQALAAADAALYRAKRSGRDRIEAHREDDEPVHGLQRVTRV